MMEKISSVANPRIKTLRGLLRKKERMEQGQFLIEGVHCVGEALSSGVSLRMMVAEEGRLDEYAALLPDYLPILAVTEAVMESLSETKTPQGILAVGDLLTRPFSEAKKAELLLILDDIRDPGNLGTLIRTADAAGFDGVLVSGETVDVHNPKAVRSSMGSIFHLPIWESEGLARDAEKMQGNGWALLSGQLDGQDFFHREISLKKQALVIGNEANGVTAAVRAACHYPVRLPMAGKSESLNAAAAAAIMMYDMSRVLGRFDQ